MQQVKPTYSDRVSKTSLTNHASKSTFNAMNLPPISPATLWSDPTTAAAAFWPADTPWGCTLSLFYLTFGFGIVTASLLALSAVGLSLQFGVTNFVNFGYGALLGLGMYFTYALSTTVGLPFWFAALGGTLLTGVASVIVDVLILEPFVRRGTSGFFMLIVTFGLSLILLNLIQLFWGVSFTKFAIHQGTPLKIGPFSFTPNQLAIIAIAIVVLIGVHLLLTRTTLGRSMRAMSDNASLAKVSGINTGRVTMWT